MPERAVLIMAKSPVPGRVKTRLAPPCTDAECAMLAEAALLDTLDVAMATGRRVVLALDGCPGPWLPPHVEVFAQRGSGLGERLGAAWHDFGRGGVQIGMDTPQLTPAGLDAAIALLDEHRSALGPAADGGWWGLALRAPAPGAFDGVPMSEPDTARHQSDRLRELGLAPVTLATLIDIDHWADALAVAELAPHTRTAQVVAQLCSSPRSA